MGLQIWFCSECKVQFGWCSVGGFSSWGEHKPECIMKGKPASEWRVDV